MQWKAAGAKRSPNYEHVILMNWSRRTRTNIGERLFAGMAFYVEPHGDMCAFVVEQIGFDAPRIRLRYPFVSGKRGGHHHVRPLAFMAARRAYEQLKSSQIVER